MLVTAASCALRNTARRAASASTLPPRLAVRSVRPFSSTPLSLALKTRYTPEHEWVTLDSDSNIGTVGITDYAQKSLGDVVFVELPTEGTEVAQGEQIGAVESVKAASDIYAPVAGSIVKINTRLSDESNLLNKSPEKDGWLCQIRLTNPAEFETLLDEGAYKKLTDAAEH